MLIASDCITIRYGPAGQSHASDITRYDYTPVDVILIPSVPGWYSGSDLWKYGHMKVRRALSGRSRSANSGRPEREKLICQFSSVGSVSDNFVNELMTSFSCSIENPAERDTKFNNNNYCLVHTAINKSHD